MNSLVIAGKSLPAMANSGWNFGSSTVRNRIVTPATAQSRIEG